MKYIDAEKLFNDLEERVYAYSEGYANGDEYRKDAIETLLKDIQYQLSLQQEQPMIQWHPATESPGKLRVLMAFTRKDLKKGQYVFSPVRLFSENAIPAECVFEDGEDRKQLPVAWAVYTDVVNGITKQMCQSAAAAAWGWWPDEKK